MYELGYIKMCDVEQLEVNRFALNLHLFEVQIQHLHVGYLSGDNFIIGSRDGADFEFGASCCLPTLSVTAVDLANNNNVCYAGRDRSGQVWSLTRNFHSLTRTKFHYYSTYSLHWVLRFPEFLELD